MGSDPALRRRLRRRAAVLAAALWFGLVHPAVPALAETVFVFEGGGYGHSVGLSQFGAYGMALDGYSWQEIITHYYSDTEVAPADPKFTDPPIWVGITQEQQTVEFLVREIGPDPVGVSITLGEETLAVAAGETITIEHRGDGRCRVAAPAGELNGACWIDLEWDGWETYPTTALQLEGCTLPDWNAPGGTVFKPCTYARGTMHVRPDNNSETVDVAVEIDIEDYVLGISESPYAWGSTGGMAALEAQAVAARSYAIHRAVDRGDPQDRPWCWCHIYDTPVDQNYVGWGHGTQNWIDAVRNTEDMVATHPSEVHDGSLLPIEAFYSSSTFGWTEHSEHGFTQYVPYLRGVDDHWSLDPRIGNHSGRWVEEFTASNLAARLPGLSTVTGLEVTECSPSGAALEITFTGSGGPRTFTTRQLRGYLGLRSMQIIRAGSPLPDSAACPQPGDDPPPEEGGPVALTDVSIDDDSAGDSLGDGDGLAECGEVVEVFTTISNEGPALTGVAATLISDDPFVSIRWNTSSTFPPLPEGGSAANDGDWDLEIAAVAPARHNAVLTMHVVSENGGPWDLDVTIPIRCGTVDAAATTGVPDLDGNDIPEIATAARAESGRQVLSARDASTGEVVATVPLAPALWTVVDIETVPGAPDRVAVLLVRGNGTTRVVVADLTAGQRAAVIGFGKGHDPVALSVTPEMDGGGHGYIVLLDRGNGRSKLVMRSEDGSRLAGRGAAAAPIDLESIGEAAEVAVLGTRPTGQSIVIALDLAAGEKLSAVRLGATPAVDIETLPAAAGPASDEVAVLLAGNGESTITSLNARTGVMAETTIAPVAIPLDLEVLPGTGGGSTGVAVLGIAADGEPAVVVVDTPQPRLLAGPVFAEDATPVDLAVVAGHGPSGTVLATLGATSAFSAIVVLCDSVSGETLGTIPVP